MGCTSNGGAANVPPEQRLNVFALVIYIPDPLGGFLDDLRRELVPHYNPHAHVSVLPPRPLAVPWDVASEKVRATLEAHAPFEIEISGLQVFPVTDVLYLGIGAGGDELARMHAGMNQGDLAFEEPFVYHPHVTLAQEIPHEEVPQLYETARRRWEAYPGPRSFRVERAAFVQNTMQNCWLDLAEYSLGAVAVR